MIETKALIPVTVKSEGFGPIIFRTKDSVYHFYQYYGIMPSMGDEHHNLYFIEDRKIKEGVDEWYIDDFLSKPRSSGGAQYKDKQKVIVATTNQSLIEKDVPAIPEEYVRHYCYKNGDTGSVDIEMESVYIEPEGIHSNRGDWKITPKLGENSLGEPEVIVYHEPAPMVDWNQFTMTQFIEHLENEFRFSSTGTAKAVFELIKANKNMREGLGWIKKEYIENVNEQDAITEKIDNLLKEKH
jgi:hypothetical protein